MKFDRSIAASSRPQLLLASLVSLALAVAAGCSSSSSGTTPVMNLKGTVTGPSGVAVEGATVYLVPTTSVPKDEITAAGVLARTTLAIDEPLEDAVANAGASFPKAVTAADGGYLFDEVPDGRYFLFVQPAVSDQEHLPGGSLCRVSVKAEDLRATTQDIVVTSSPPADAEYVGMSGCLVCHEDTVGMPEWFQRINVQEHLEEMEASEPDSLAACFECHGGHDTAP